MAPTAIHSAGWMPREGLCGDNGGDGPRGSRQLSWRPAGVKHGGVYGVSVQTPRHEEQGQPPKWRSSSPRAHVPNVWVLATKAS